MRDSAIDSEPNGARVIELDRRILGRQALVGVSAFLTVALFAPRLLMLEADVASGVFSAGAVLALLGVVFTLATTAFTLRRLAPLVRSLVLREADVQPAEIGRVANLPAALSLRFFAFTSLASALVLVPAIRPERLDLGRAVSLVILAMTILAGASLPHYVLMRQAALDLLEIAPLGPLNLLIEALELRGLPTRRIGGRLLLAVVAPVALMGASAVLVTHAHLRTLTEQSRRATALLLARTALEPAPNAPNAQAGRIAAANAAAPYGFQIRFEPQSAPTTEPTFTRDPDGQLVATAPLEDGQAVLRFGAELDLATISGGVLVASLAVVIAALVSGLFGRILASDLEAATRGLKLLGTESVLRGDARIARPARFALVADLGRAVEALTERFRVFAGAQERALAGREAAQRMRGLLFASVSHDLKSPLNAVLGFAELVGQGELTEAQRESLELIQRRGRELLALIETILDAARVEAGQLQLAARHAQPVTMIAEAVRKARELASDALAPVHLDIPPGLPSVPADPVYGTRALAVIIAHGIRTAAGDSNGRGTHVRAKMVAPTSGRGPDRLQIDVDYSSRDVTRAQLELLFARQATGRARGLTLGLSLARSVIELHGGAIEVDESPYGYAICHVWLPVETPSIRPKLSSFATLG